MAGLVLVGAVAVQEDRVGVFEDLLIRRPAVRDHHGLDPLHVGRVLQAIGEQPAALLVLVLAGAVALFAGDENDLLWGGRPVSWLWARVRCLARRVYDPHCYPAARRKLARRRLDRGFVVKPFLWFAVLERLSGGKRLAQVVNRRVHVLPQ